MRSAPLIRLALAATVAAALAGCGGGSSNANSGNGATPSSSAQLSAETGPAGATAGSFGPLTLGEDWNGSLDTRLWGTRMPHWTTPDLDNWKIEGGLLKLWTPRNEHGEFEFNNRAIITVGKFSQRYGWFEMEAKLPPGAGLWPSFWLYGIYGTTRPEINIMESFGGVDQWWGDPNPIDYGAAVWMSDIVSGAVRIGSVRPGHHGLANFDLTRAFHKYGARWEPDGITFYFDGKQVGNKIVTTAFDMELFIIVGMGTGRVGDYNGPTSKTPTNSEFQVNYVRAWALPQGTTVNGKRIGN